MQIIERENTGSRCKYSIRDVSDHAAFILYRMEYIVPHSPDLSRLGEAVFRWEVCLHREDNMWAMPHTYNGRRIHEAC